MVASHHILDGRNDIAPRSGRSVAEFSRECLDSDLPHSESFQHCLNRNLRTDEGAVGLQVKLVDQFASDQAQARANVAESGLKESAKRMIVDPRDEDPEPGIEFCVAKSDD